MKNFLLLSFLVILTPDISGQDLFNYSNSLKFAEYLSRTQQYNLAIQEYERLLFLQPQNDTIKVKVLKSYRQSALYDKATNRAESFYQNILLAPKDIALEYSRSLILDKKHYESIYFNEQSKTLSQGTKKINTATSLMLLNRWKDAEKELDTIVECESCDSAQREVILRYRSIIKENQNIRLRKQFTAIALSTIVPGTGKMYAGNWKDGLFSFLMVASTGFQSYRGFRKNGINSARGWIYGGLAVGFYGGNIYGTHKAVKAFNNKVLNNRKKKIEDAFSTTL